jgi:hypothetical protein
VVKHLRFSAGIARGRPRRGPARLASLQTSTRTTQQGTAILQR